MFFDTHQINISRSVPQLTTHSSRICSIWISNKLFYIL